PHLAQMQIRRRAGYVAAHTWYYPGLSVRQFLRFIGNFYPEWDEERTDTLLTTFELEPDVKIGALSVTSRRKLGVVAALGHRPSLLILDEPTKDFGEYMRDHMLKFLHKLSREEKVTIVVSSTVSNEFDRFADGVLTLTHGQVAECAQ